MSTTVVVCNVYKLLKDGKSFTKQGMKLERENAVIMRKWADDRNANWKQGGEWHEIDEEKTAEYYVKGEEKREKRKLANAVKDKFTNAMTDLVMKANDKVEEKVEKKVDGLKSLRAKYETQLGKKVPPRYKNDAVWINSKLS